jgi:hypothetical protein
LHVGWRYFTPFAGHQWVAGQRVRSDGAAYQAQRRQTDGRRHASHLPVFPLLERNREPTGRVCGAAADRRIARPDPVGFGDVDCLAWLRDEVAKIEWRAQPGQCLLARTAFDLYQIGFGLLVIRVADTVLQAAVVGQQQQAFAIGIESPGRIYIGDFDIVGQCFPFEMGGKLAQYLVRFIE